MKGYLSLGTEFLKLGEKPKMSTTVNDLTHGSLSIGVQRPSVSRDPEAWKKLIGQKPIAARLATLPEKKVRGSALISSTLFQMLLVGAVVAIPMFFPDKLATKIMYEVTPIAAPDTSVPVPVVQKPPVVRAKVEPTPPPPVQQPVEPVRVAKLIAPRNLIAPKPKPVEVRDQEAPKLDQPLLEAKFEAPVDEPARPREPVKVGNLSTGSAAPATVNKPIDKVQTGGFGDPNGVPGDGNPNKRSNINHVGSPLLPPGPGYGNGTGGANGVKGTVASAGFGNGVAIPPSGNGGGSRGQVKAGGFAAAVSTADVPKAKQADSVAAVTQVVIVSKPNPVYSDEARNLRIEGDVLVDVVFQASGAVQVNRVVKGLGHGLDEAAVRAAQQIKFKPALRNGTAVDFPATVHIVFQLAF
jgi:TonB family protein